MSEAIQEVLCGFGLGLLIIGTLLFFQEKIMLKQYHTQSDQGAQASAIAEEAHMMSKMYEAEAIMKMGTGTARTEHLEACLWVLKHKTDLLNVVDTEEVYF